MSYELVISNRAEIEIAKIRDTIAKDNPQAASKVASRIYDVTETIAHFPGIGGSVSERFGIKSDYLFFVVLPYTYIIFYKTVGDKVFIGRVIDGRRDCVRVLTVDRK